MSRTDVRELIAREHLTPGQIRSLALRRMLAVAPVVMWYLISGFGGLFFTYLWAFTDHTAAHANQNLWHCSPLAWVAMVLLMAKKRRAAAHVAAAIVSLSVFGCFVWAFGRFMGGPIAQANGQFILLALPLNLASAWVLRRVSRPRRGAAVEDAADSTALPGPGGSLLPR
jgi:hypothetical protein